MGGAPPARRSTIAALQTYSPHLEEWGAFPPTEVAAAAAAFIASYFRQKKHEKLSSASAHDMSATLCPRCFSLAFECEGM